MATLVPVLDDQYNRAYQLQYLGTNRPWLSLYGTRIRPVAPLGSTSRQPLNDPSLLHNLLPDELLYEIFVRMSPYTLGKAMCVCRKWRYAIRSPVLWRIACLKAWQMLDQKDNELILRKHYGCSWRKMWLLRPRLRFDGIYVSRNTYVRSGVIQWKSTKPAHLVCYYRYFRFFPNAKFLYKNSSSTLKDVAKTMQRRSKKENVYGGLYTLSHDQVEAAILYSGLRPTVLRMRVRIRGTCEGANNRLDMTLLVTSGVDENEARENEEEVLNTVENWQVNETHNPDVPAVSHSRGLSPFVFVPFEEVESSELNLPVEEMDFFIPG